MLYKLTDHQVLKCKVNPESWCDARAAGHKTIDSIGSVFAKRQASKTVAVPWGGGGIVGN